MTLEELWQLFPIILKDHNPNYFLWYQQEKAEILDCLGAENIFRINHIGSSAVPGLIAKPIVDILLEVNRQNVPEEVIQKLKNAGWILISSEMQPEMKLSFNKGYTSDGFAEKVFHLHVRYPGDWDELYFHDYLVQHPETAREYEQLKLKLLQQFEHDRDGYTQAKTDFIRDCSQKARLEYNSRYQPA